MCVVDLTVISFSVAIGTICGVGAFSYVMKRKSKTEDEVKV